MVNKYFKVPRKLDQKFICGTTLVGEELFTEREITIRGLHKILPLLEPLELRSNDVYVFFGVRKEA